MTGFYSGLRRYIEEEWSTEASKCDSNIDCLEECTQHLGECLPRYVFPFLCKAMTRTSLCFRSIVATLFCILNDLAFAIFNYRLILLTISCNSVYHIAIKMNSACLLRSAGASYDML